MMTQGAASPRKTTQPAPKAAPEIPAIVSYETPPAMPPGVDQDLAETKDAIEGREAERPLFASITAGLLIRKSEARASAEGPQFASITSDLLARKGEAQPWSGTGTPEAEIAAAAQWQEKSARAVTELTARCRTAEEALAAARAVERSRSEAELTDLRDQLERLRRNGEAQIAAAKLEAAETLKAAEAQWQDQAAQSVAELTARCRAAEEALASADAADTGKSETDHAHVRGLNHEINSLQRSLAEREAHLEQALTRLEALRLGTAASSQADTWHPLSNRAAQSETEESQKSGHLWRDALVVFFAVMGAVLFWPRVEQALVTAGVLDAPALQRTVIAAVPAPILPPPKPEHPTAIVARGVNMRGDHATGAEVLAILKSGTQVTIIGHSGNWDQVQIPDAGGKILQGWVYGSYLDASGAVSPR